MIVKNGYKIRDQKKVDITYCRMDETMIKRLNELRTQTGISKSELIREGVRRLLAETEDNGEISITV